MNQSDRTELILILIALLVAIALGLAMGIRGCFDADRFVTALTPDLGMLFGAGVVVGAVLVALFGGFVVGARLPFDL